MYAQGVVSKVGSLPYSAACENFPPEERLVASWMDVKEEFSRRSLIHPSGAVVWRWEGPLTGVLRV